MKKQAAGYFVVLSCAVLVAGGCAKTQMVKKDESMVPPTANATEPQAPAKKEVAKVTPVKEAPVKQESAATPAPTERLKEVLTAIYFNFDSYKLSDTARSALVKNADLLRKDAAEKIRIEGNCDERGSDEYNLALGEKRAKAAMQYLVTMGVPADRLSVISYGKEKPAGQGHDEAAWAKNRRDDFVVLSK